MEPSAPDSVTSLLSQDAQWTDILTRIPVHRVDPRDYPRIIRTLTGISEGKSWSDIALTGLSKPEYVWMKLHSRDFKALAKQAEQVAEEVRQLEREESAHCRAVKGEEIPVYTPKGDLAGTYWKASDRLMELLLKASDPARFREAKADNSGPGRVILNVQFQIPSRVPKTLEGEEVYVKEIRAEEDREPGEDGAAAAGHLGALGPGSPAALNRVPKPAAPASPEKA